MISDIYVTRIWGTIDGDSTSYTLRVNTGGRTLSTAVSISKLETTDGDDHVWAKAMVRSYCTISGDVIYCPVQDPPAPNPKSYQNKLYGVDHICYELQVRNDDGYLYADCPITIFFHN